MDEMIKKALDLGFTDYAENIKKPSISARFRTFKKNLVGAKGFEPSTSWSQTKHSTRLSYTPKRSLL